jgi:RNA polymerase sigma factor (sigma-70 family)
MTLPAQHLDDDGYRSDTDFEFFFERWYPSVLSYSRRFGVSYAEEIAQETLFRAFSCFSDLRRDMPLPWLRTVARNVACDLHRAGKRLWPLPEAGDADPPDVTEGPEESLLRLERVRHMRAALSDISPEDRQLLHMLVIDESSVEDVADRLAVTANTVRVRLHRARRRLGSHYLRRAGTHAIALPALGAIALRRVLRPTTNTATRSAPALAAVAALGGLTAATVVLSQPSSPQRSWSAATTEQQSYRDPDPVPVRRQPVTTTSVPNSTAHTTSRRPSAPQAPVTVPAIKTRMHISDPKKPGNWGGFGVSVPTPWGPLWVSADIVRSAGDSLVCQVTHQNC